MSSIELLLLALTVSAGTPRVASPNACPASVKGVKLTGSQVYDGPIAENAILKPDQDRTDRGATVASWDVGYIYEQGRQVHLLCEYAKGSSVVVKVARPVKTCLFTARGRRESLACR